LSGVGGERRRTRALVFVPRAEFAHVDRTQPEAPEGDFEQRTKASEAVDAGGGDEGRGKRCRALHGGAVGKWPRGGNCLRGGRRWGKDKRAFVYPWPRLVPWRAGPSLFNGDGLRRRRSARQACARLSGGAVLTRALFPNSSQGPRHC
jgi:hypothetical protein